MAELLNYHILPSFSKYLCQMNTTSFVERTLSNTLALSSSVLGLGVAFARIFNDMRSQNASVLPSMSKILRIELEGQHRKEPDIRAVVRKKGNGNYNLDIFVVETKDGYKLTIHRLKRKEEVNHNVDNDDDDVNDIGERKRVAFLQHGLKSSSADWLIGDMAYTICDAGYDVWMGNFRGNRFSKEHIAMTDEQKEFWDFSFDEHGSVDLPCMLDLVLTETGVESIHYFGHSMGTTALFAMLNHFPERNRQIEHCTALAPVTDVKSMHGIPAYFIPMASISAKWAKHYDFMSVNFPKWIPCYSFVALAVVHGLGHHLVNLEDAADILTFSPAPCSITTIEHFIENFNQDIFRGRGTEGQVYSLENVTCPVSLWYSDDDWAAGEADVRDIAAKLPNVKHVRKVEMSRFGHLDFLWAREARVVYEQMLQDIRECEVEVCC